ncbi:MAG TPA: helix-turn-helix transcriptional regulator [Cellulomonas sp.]
MPDETDPVAAAAGRWLAVGRDVLVRGDVGSGKSHLLDRLGETLARRVGYRVILLRARRQTMAYGPLLTHPSYPTGERPADERGLARWLEHELQGRRNVLLLDDLDRFDPETLAVVWTVLQAGSTHAVSTLTDAPLGAIGPLAADLIAERAPARLRTRALGLSATAGLLTTVLGGPATAGLVASLSTRSAGNPRVTIALADAARFAGAITSVHGVWTKAGSLDSAPTDAVAHALLARLPPAEVRALTTLARSGPVDTAEAGRLVHPELLDSLAARGRVVGHVLGDGRDLMAVSPPALAQALRGHGPDPTHPTDHDEEPAMVAVRPVHGWDQLVTESDEDDEYWRWSAELAGLVNGRQAVAEAQLLSVWQLAPTARHACALLAVLMRRVAPDEIAAVIAGTAPDATDTPRDLALLRALTARWEMWRAGQPGRARAGAVRAGSDPARGLRTALLAAVQAGASDQELSTAGTIAQPVLPGWDQLIRAGTLLDAGRADLALELCETLDLPDGGPGLGHYLDGVHGIALLMLGRVPEAEQLARQRLDRAVTELDGTGIRVHACVLAEVLMSARQLDPAWRALSTALRLGPAGPIENTFYRRALALGTVLRARAGDTTLARALLVDLESTPAAYHPVLHSVRVLADAALDDAAGLGTVGEELWRHGRRYAREGLALPALLCWLAQPGPLPADHLRQVQTLAARVRLPLLDPLVRLHEALATGDPVLVADRLAQARHLASQGLTRSATALLVDGSDQAASAPDADAAPPVGAGDDTGSGGAGTPAGSGTLLGAPLTEREREIAQCVRDGLSNRDIAREFSLSPRTVENHVSRVLRKLGFRSRRDLASHLGS